uniref:Retrotransposon gag domain-containing protein n=1 Tax=Chara braunii TaxID=69332 RepID=A0A388LK67_CHABU
MDGAAGRRDNVDDGRNDIQELARVIRHSQREPYPKIDVPLFDGNHASSWADKFEQLGYSNEWTDEKMLRMVKRFCQVEYRDEIDELVRISRNWPDFKARLLEKYQLSDRLLDLRDLRAVDRKKFGTTKQLLSEFERVARLIPDLSDKDRYLIFLDNFNDVEQSKLVEGMQGRYDWTKVRQNALMGKFDDILYRLLRQQKVEREKVKLGEVKDGEIYKTLTCIREMVEGLKEERLKFQVMMAKEKISKRKGKEPVVEKSDSESEEENEPPRKLTKAERKVLNQIRGGQGTSRKQGKNGGQNNQGGNGGAGGGSSEQNSQDQGKFQPEGGRGRG